MKKTLSVSVLVLTLIFCTAPLIVFANECDIPDSPSAEKLCDVIFDIADILMWIGIALAVIIVIIGGIRYMTAGDSEDKVKGARKMIINGLIGAAIIMAASYLVGAVAEFIENKFG